MEPKSKCTQYNLPTHFFYPQAKPGRPKKTVDKQEKNRLHLLQEGAARFCNGSDDGIVCEYKKQCLEMGLHNREPGVWGGTTEAEREVILSRYERERYKAV